MKAVSFLVVVLFSLAAQAAPAKPIAIKVGSSNVEFIAIGRPSALKVVGKGKALDGNLAQTGDSLTGDVNFDLASLNTGISMRDEHMKKKYLEVEKFPKAKLSIIELKLPDGAAKGGDFTASAVPFSGKLTLHGVERPVQGNATITRKGVAGTADATFAIKISDYGIAVPSFSGITIADDVNVKVDTTGTYGEK